MTANAQITLTYPDHLLEPTQWVTFIEMAGFDDDWKSLGLTDVDLWLVQTIIGAHPKGSPIIPGTGGLRKLKWAPPKKGGRRRWYRLCYVFFPEAAVVLLVVAYAKNEKADISAADKRYFRELIARENAVFSLERAVR